MIAPPGPHAPADGSKGELPLVSVVVPTFNRQAMLSQTVASILAQTYPRIEVIIVDNVSEDGTEAAVKAFDDARIRYRRNPNNGIIAKNRNLGIRLSRGKYVALCDDDDLWVPQKLEEQVAALESNPEAGLCYSDACAFSDDEIVDPSLVKWKVFRGHFSLLLLRNFIPSSSVVLRKEIMDAEGGFDETGDLAPYEDYEMWLRIAHSYDLVYVDHPLLRYRVHGQNWAGRYGNRQKIVVSVLQSVRKKLGITHPFLYVAVFLRSLKAASAR